MESIKIPPIIRRHFSPEGYLSLHLLLGILVLFLATWAFASVAEDVASHERIVQLDAAVVNAIHANWVRLF